MLYLNISNFRCLVSCVFFVFVFYFCFFVFFELEVIEGWFFQNVHRYIWAVAGHELGTLSIQAQSLFRNIFTNFVNIKWSFSSMIKQVHNPLTVHDNSWTLKFDNFSEFQNVITLTPSVIMTHCVRKPICYSPLS